MGFKKIECRSIMDFPIRYIINEYGNIAGSINRCNRGISAVNASQYRITSAIKINFV